MKTTLLFLILSAGAIWGGPLPACSSQFQYSCAQAAVGGYYVLTPLAGTGSTEITGFISGGTQVFDATVPSPPSGAADYAVGYEISNAQAQIAQQSGMVNSLPACPVLTAQPCLASSLAQSTVGSGGPVYTFTAVDTAATQQVNQNTTTLIGKLNGAVFSTQTIGSTFASNAVQSAILALENQLVTAGGAPGSPFQTSTLTTLTTQTTYQETGGGPLPAFSLVTTDIFGPALIYCTACPSQVGNGGAFYPIAVGQLDVNVESDFVYQIDRTVTTTNTYLTAQTYEIDAFTATSVPEVSSGWLTLIGLGAAGVLVRGRQKSIGVG